MYERILKPSEKPRKRNSLRYELILNGAVMRYPDGREVCCKTPKGRDEYRRRTLDMRLRQRCICSLCELFMAESDTTFEHEDLRGMGGSRQDDRIVLPDGTWINSAAHGWCNAKKGSARL